jgi:hypothetical protein
MRVILIKCAWRNWRKYWRKTMRQKLAQRSEKPLCQKLAQRSREQFYDRREKSFKDFCSFLLQFFGGSTLLRELDTFGMYLQDLLREQALLAAIVAQTLHTVAYLALLDDVDIRLKSPFQQRVTWDNFVQDNKDRPLFRRHLHMSYESFIVFLEKIREHINVDNKMGLLQGGKIIPEVHLYATLRYLAGGSYSDVCFFVEFLFHHFIALYGGLYMQLTIPSRSTFLPRPSSVQMWLQSLKLSVTME